MSEFPPEELLNVGESQKEDVTRALGSPSSTSDFGEETWYYISARKERQAFFAPEVTDQKVVKITFDENGIMKSMKRYTLEDGKEVVMVEKTTPTEGHSLGFFEQILGNIGRFNKSQDADLDN